MPIARANALHALPGSRPEVERSREQGGADLTARRRNRSARAGLLKVAPARRRQGSAHHILLAAARWALDQGGDTLLLAHIFSAQPQQIMVRSLVIVGQRAGWADLHVALEGMNSGLKSLHLTGDANAPGAIAHAIYQAHKTAQTLGRDTPVVKRDRGVTFAATPA